MATSKREELCISYWVHEKRLKMQDGKKEKDEGRKIGRKES